MVGVVLSGTGADGTEGLRAIKAAGGVAVAQDPAEAQLAGMPRYAARNDGVGHVLRAAEIAHLLDRLARAPADDTGRDPAPADPAEDPDGREAAEHDLAGGPPPREGAASGFTCPECGGPLWEARDGAARAWALIDAPAEWAVLQRPIAAEGVRDDPGIAAEAASQAREAELLARAIPEALPRPL